MAHTIEHHNKCVNELCRICCNRSWTRKQKDSREKPRLCKNKKDDIFFICNINNEDDVCNKHSRTICSKCDVKIRKIKQTKTSKSKVMVQNLKVSAFAAAHLWTEYNLDLSIDDCSICGHYLSFSSGSVREAASIATTSSTRTSTYELDRPTASNIQLETTQDEPTNMQLESAQEESTGIQQTTATTAENTNTPVETA